MENRQDVADQIDKAWMELAGESTDRNENIFALGVTSLEAIRMSMQVSRLAGVNIKPSVIFDNPTLVTFKRAVMRIMTLAESSPH